MIILHPTKRKIKRSVAFLLLRSKESEERPSLRTNVLESKELVYLTEMLSNQERGRILRITHSHVLFNFPNPILFPLFGRLVLVTKRLFWYYSPTS
jgi:hypothetical protein